MSAGTARRLMVLPAGNQVELAAVVSHAELTTEETELLVSLWQKTKDVHIRRFLLSEPRRALQNARPEKVAAPLDPRLNERGRRMARALQALRGVALRVTEVLQTLPPPTELALLEREIELTTRVLPATLEALGFAGRCLRSAGSGGSSVTPTSADC
jgi:hypothetical protein